MITEALQNSAYVATFIPYDPPRGSWFALWNPAEPGTLLAETPPAGLDQLKRVDVELVLPASGRGTVKTLVSALKFPMVDALAEFAELGVGPEVDPSVAAWSRVVRAGLALIAKGSLLPWVSPHGWDTWRIDPLDGQDQSTVLALADSMPAYAHCTPAGEKRGQISDPVFAVRSCFDALADRLVRSPAAPIGRSSDLFAQLAPTRVRHLRPWVGDIAGQYCAASGLGLMVNPPGTISGDFEPEDGVWRISYQLTSASDPSLIVDASEVWAAVEDCPAELSGPVSHLGKAPDLTLLSGLARLAKVCPLFGRHSLDSQPLYLDLSPQDLDQFLIDAEAISDSGVAIRWPSDLVAPRIQRRLVVSSQAPSAINPERDTLIGLLDVNWEFLIDGLALSEDELVSIAEAKRSIIPLRQRWVRLDAAALAIIDSSTPELSVGEIMAGALGSEIEDPASGEVIDLRLDVSLEGLAGHLANLRGEREQAEPDGLNAELRPYQKRGLAWMSDLAEIGLGGVLADDMGLGKTVQLLALHAHRRGPTLVVCPTSVLNNWVSEAKRFCPEAQVTLYHGASRSLDGLGDNHLVITSYGVVRSDAEALAGLDWDLIAADEAQNIKNPRSRSARSLRTIDSKTRVAMTGTPVENRLSELWSIMDWAVPGLLGNLNHFRRTVAVPIERHNDPEAARRLSKVIAPFLLRRTKEDPGIAPELPGKSEADVVVPLTPEQATLYRATTAEVLDGLSRVDGIERQGLVLKLLTSLKQITNHPAHYLGEPGPLAGRSGKLTALEELLAASERKGESTLIFSQYVAMGNLLVSHLSSLGVDTDILHGGLSIKARARLVDRFQSGDLRVLILSLKAAGTGLNLTKATSVIHYDRWWNPAVEDQATDRAYRIGQTSRVSVHRLITKGTVEDRVAQLLSDKRDLADKVIGAGESWISSLSDGELADLVALESPRPQPTLRLVS